MRWFESGSAVERMEYDRRDARGSMRHCCVVGAVSPGRRGDSHQWHKGHSGDGKAHIAGLLISKTGKKI
jgi:hypothetical protein